MTAEIDVLIVGAGHAGAQAAITLRQQKFAGSVMIVGAEPDLPYERPPLSKQYLAGSKSSENLQLRDQSFWERQDVTLSLGSRAIAVDPKRRVVHLDDGRPFCYRKLIWAAGGRARRLSCAGHSLAGVHGIRTRADVDRLAAELRGARQIVVVGGGYIGLEVAATLVGMGKRVTVVESCDRVLARVVGAPLSRFYESVHRARGVDVRLGTTVASLEHRDGRVSGVRLDTSEVLAADLVIVGIGIVPEVEVLAHAGANVSDGVLVDSCGRTSLPDVFAIGDCARHVNPFAHGDAIRLESVQNATDQAGVAARVIAGQVAKYEHIPWFWSEQYEFKLQTIGLNIGHDDILVRGDPVQGSFSVVYLRNGMVTALDCVNAPRDFQQGKALILSRRPADRRQLQDPSIPLKWSSGVAV